jgi:DNA-binding NtrC family response regulator
LRERREDIPLLARHFLELYARRYRKFLTGFSDEAASALLRYEWPGNVRELDHAVERAVLMAKGEVWRRPISICRRARKPNAASKR